MGKLFAETRINLEAFPENQVIPISDAQFTIGDLHGNALKLIWFLCRAGIMQLDKDPQEAKSKYQQLVSIYKTASKDLTNEKLTIFDQIIKVL